MLDFEYDKPSVVIKAGTEVTWVGAGAGPRHSAKADDESFDTGLYGPGKSKTIKFDKPGTFPYYCELHGDKGGEGMAGTITVVQ
jgi:plastocyanin